MNQELVLCKSEDSISEDGILFVRIRSTISTMVRMSLVALGFILAAITIPIQNSSSISRDLDFTIYQDGSTHVFYKVDADPLEPDFSIILFGQAIDNFVSQDENGFLLESQIDGNVAVIETFGANTISLDYDTHDLISKDGKIWTFSVSTPIDYNLLMPKNTVIVGMSTFPLNLEILDEQSLVTLPKGSIDIDYFFSISGSAQSATNAIDEAQNTIEQIKNNGISTPLADMKLAEAISAFDQGRFSDSQELANESKNLAIQQQSVSPTFDTNNSLILIIGAIAAAGIVVTVIAKRRKSASNHPELLRKQEFTKLTQKPLDLETIFRIKPDLREDDKELVTFIFENGGQALESELRKKFLQPRTTMWRAVKRLEREGVIKIEKKELQNLVRLSDELKENTQ